MIFILFKPLTDTLTKTFKYKRYSRKTNGFSLIELSLVLAVIGLLYSLASNGYVKASDSSKRKQTLYKMAIIEDALAKFVAANDRLPCPARISLAKNDSNIGVEFSNTAADLQVDLSASLPANYSASSNIVIGGSVPTNTLKLPLDMMLDGWGNRFVYALPKAMCGVVNYGVIVTPYYFENQNMGLVTILDASGATRTNSAAYVLLSNGSNGYGAWPKNGGVASSIGSASANEIENSHSGGTWNAIFVSSEPSSTFDDIVHYKMKWQIVREAGSVISNAACTTAHTIITTADLNATSALCSTKPASSNCALFINTLASKVNQWCLNK